MFLSWWIIWVVLFVRQQSNLTLNSIKRYKGRWAILCSSSGYVLLISEDGRVVAGCRDFASVFVALSHWHQRRKEAEIEIKNSFDDWSAWRWMDNYFLERALETKSRADKFIECLELQQ